MLQSNLITYQIYLKSFNDTTNSGTGDLRGVINKLDYLSKLGINTIWLTPIYQSPQYDNGYDVSDYFSIDEEYGNVDDFKELIKKAHFLKIKVILDVVLNHLSIESDLFIKAIASKDNEYQDYFFFKDNIPNNFKSFFYDDAWCYIPSINKYYYHAFSKQQVDLNHSNKKVFEYIITILKYWINLGVDGFRYDVINFLKVKDIFHLNNPIDKEGKQIHQYDKDIPGIKDYLTTILNALKEDYPNLISIAEIGSNIHNEICSYNEIFDYTFQFNLGSINNFNINEYLKEYQDTTKDIKVPTLFFNSHDMSRSLTRLFNNNIIDQINLFALTCFLNGAIFIYQGEEFGMEDFIASNINEINDIQGRNTYYNEIDNNPSHALAIALKESRDGSRSMVLWNNSIKNNISWINHTKGFSLEEDLNREISIYKHYHKLINLRNKGFMLLDSKINYQLVSSDKIILSKEDNKNILLLEINYIKKQCIIKYNEEVIYEFNTQ